jgi:chromosomal replication initiator protein
MDRKNYLSGLEAAIGEAAGKPLRLSVSSLGIEPSPSPAPTVSVETAPAGKAPAAPKKNEDDDIFCDKYTFDSFVIGNSNRLAHAASLAVSEAPGRVYNPLFIHSDVGLGKTHLMRAIGNKIKTDFPEKKALYISCEKFTNEMVNSIRDKKQESFRKKYRHIDCLLIDDIQFLSKKVGTQEEFFHTFNTLYDANKQIVIASDKPPKEIDGLEERLCSRFESGLLTDIQPPDLETRMAILRKKALIKDIAIPDEVIYFIANNIENNVRELEGALIKVIAVATAEGGEITPDNAQRALEKIIRIVKKPVTAEKIFSVVTQHYKIKTDELLSKKRTKNIAFVRQLTMYLCRETTDFSLEKIGSLFSRDHTTVIHAIEKKIKPLIETDSETAKEVSDLIRKIKS